MVKTQSFLELKNEVFAQITEGLKPHYTYHAVSHISMVLRDATYLCNKLNLPANEIQLVQTAACLHDYGFIFSHVDHEERSCVEARQMLPDYGYTEDEIEKICSMIMSTKIPQSPKNLLDQILCDADLFYLGSDYYFEIADLFKKELTALGVLNSEEQWLNIQISFLENHHFRLPITNKLLRKKKLINLSVLKASK